jgi:hypothetical protein
VDMISQPTKNDSVVSDRLLRMGLLVMGHRDISRTTLQNLVDTGKLDMGKSREDQWIGFHSL